MNTYVVALIESLEKKVDVLKDIKAKCDEQSDVLKSEELHYDLLDRTFEEKDILIYKLNKLDEGFETLYERVKTELESNKNLYTNEIKKMQSLITEITDLSSAIQALEARNKASVEKSFKRERNKLKSQRSGIKAVNSYNQAMNYKKN